MAKIRMELRDGQYLGYIKMRDGKPYYGYTKLEADNLDLDFAKHLAKSFKEGTYNVTIECTKEEVKDVWKPYTVVVK